MLRLVFTLDFDQMLFNISDYINLTFNNNLKKKTLIQLDHIIIITKTAESSSHNIIKPLLNIVCIIL